MSDDPRWHSGQMDDGNVMFPAEQDKRVEEDPVHDALMKVIWDKRRLFYGLAVTQGVISQEQARRLLDLHVQVDAGEWG